MNANENTTAPVSINDTVLLALTEAGVSAAGYESVIKSAVTKLTEREQAMTAAVIEAADGIGYGEQAKTILTVAGLSITPEPVVEEAPAEDAPEEGPLEARVSKLESGMAELLTLARRHLGSAL